MRSFIRLPYPRIKVARPFWWNGYTAALLSLAYCMVLFSVGYAVFLCAEVLFSDKVAVCIVFALINIPYIAVIVIKLSNYELYCSLLYHVVYPIQSYLGFPAAQYELGAMRLSKTGIEKIEDEALALLTKSAMRGNAFALWKLACVYSCRGARTFDLSKALECLRGAADGGQLGAACVLGCCYEAGYGVEKCLEEAARLYLYAAQHGLAPAQHNIGMCYKMGMGVSVDEEDYEMWIHRAAEQGYYDYRENIREESVMDYSVIEFWNLVLLFAQPGWNRLSEDFISREIRRQFRVRVQVHPANVLDRAGD